MSHIVDTKLVNQFLPTEKLAIPTVEAQALHDDFNGRELEDTIWGIVVSKLYQYDLADWTNTSGVPIPTQVPTTVKNIMGMWIAGRIYMKQFSEESTEKNNYGKGLVEDAISMLQGIVDRTVVIDGLVIIDNGTLDDPTVHESDPIFTIDSVY